MDQGWCCQGLQTSKDGSEFESRLVCQSILEQAVSVTQTSFVFVKKNSFSNFFCFFSVDLDFPKLFEAVIVFQKLPEIFVS